MCLHKKEGEGGRVKVCAFPRRRVLCVKVCAFTRRKERVCEGVCIHKKKGEGV